MSHLDRSINATAFEAGVFTKSTVNATEHMENSSKAPLGTTSGRPLSLCVALVTGHLRKRKTRTRYLLNFQNLKP